VVVLLTVCDIFSRIEHKISSGGRKAQQYRRNLGTYITKKYI